MKDLKTMMKHRRSLLYRNFEYYKTNYYQVEITLRNESNGGVCDVRGGRNHSPSEYFPFNPAAPETKLFECSCSGSTSLLLFITACVWSFSGFFFTVVISLRSRKTT